MSNADPISSAEGDSPASPASPDVTAPYEKDGQVVSPPSSPSVTETYLPQRLEQISQLVDKELVGNPLTTPFERSASESAKPSAEKSDSDEESIEDYMSRLLQRVNGGDAPAEQTSLSPPVVPAKRPSHADQDSPAAPDATPVSTATPEPSKETIEPRQPAKPPEDRNGLLNLRQLANESAHDALRIHGCKRLITNMYRWFATSVIGAVISCILVLASSSPATMLFKVALATMTISLLGGCKFLWEAKQLAQLTPADLDASIDSKT